MNGKIHYGYVYAKTYRELKGRLAILKVASSESKQIKNKFTGTLEAWLNYWLESIVKQTVKISTYNNYKNKSYCHIAPLIGGIPLAKLRREELTFFVEELSRTLSAGSVHSVFKILKTALNSANKQGYLEQSIYEGILLPRKKITKLVVLSTQEQRLIFQEAKKNTNYLPIVVSLETGMRIGEIAGLKWSDIDCLSRTVAINRTLQRVSLYNNKAKTSIIEHSPKTLSSERVIPLSENLFFSLLDMKKNTKSLYVFSNGVKSLEPRTINYRFKKLLRSLGLADYKFHALRHTFATRCLEQGVNVATISALLGHSSTKMTLDVYTSSSTDQERKAINKIAMIYSQ